MPSALKGKTAFVTGATSGIGRACAQALAREGCPLVLAGRRRERLDALKRILGRRLRVDVLPLDVRDRASVEAATRAHPGCFSRAEILVNAAGLARGLSPLQDGDVSDWEEMIDANLKGLLYVTRQVLPHMIRRGRGHILNLGSTAGHWTYPNGNVYCATKAGVKALTEGLRMDLLGTGVRVTSVDPGMVETEFSEVRFHGDRARAKAVYAGMTPLTPEDVAEIAVFCLSRPGHVNIQQVVVTPTDQASVTLVHRRTTGKKRP